MYRAFVTNTGTPAPGTYTVPMPANGYIGGSFESVDEALKATENHIKVNDIYPQGYRAFVIDWKTMQVVAWGEKPAPPVISWHKKPSDF